jgi:hypothetical protein
MKLIELLLKESKITYPKNHKPGMRVPEGGSMCANCEYWEKDDNLCNNKYWKSWAETDKVPYPGDEYCCDWWHPNKEKN